MIDFIIILSHFILYFCADIELPWNGSLKVIPDTFVYYDISSYDPGDKIPFKITIDYFDQIGRNLKDCYNFQIDQVPTKDLHDSYYKQNLRNVSNKNVTYVTLLMMLVHLHGMKSKKLEIIIFLLFFLHLSLIFIRFGEKK